MTGRALISAALVLLWPSQLRAFSDPELFAEAPQSGGGGGRQFTGSPRDGYSCAVCHRDGVVPEIEISGLPDAFEPARLYEVTLRWDGTLASHALQLELLTEAGEHPEVEIEPPEVLTELGRCDGDPEGDPANYAVDVEGRRVVGIRDCGASRVSFQFAAPDAAKLYFAASIVRTDSSGTAEGDGVLDLRRVLKRRGDARAGDGCELTAGRDGSGWCAGLLFGTLALFVQRRSRPSTSVVSSASTRERPT